MILPRWNMTSDARYFRGKCDWNDLHPDSHWRRQEFNQLQEDLLRLSWTLVDEIKSRRRVGTSIVKRPDRVCLKVYRIDTYLWVWPFHKNSSILHSTFGVGWYGVLASNVLQFNNFHRKTLRDHVSFDLETVLAGWKAVLVSGEFQPLSATFRRSSETGPPS
jgi:hypothetical protein